MSRNSFPTDKFCPNRAKYYQTHKEQEKAYNREYYKTHKEEVKAYGVKYYQTHKEQEKAYEAKRRELGFNILWEPELITELMEDHHITINWIIRIPKRIHRSVYHNVRSGRGMRVINNRAFKYLSCH